MTCLPLTFRRKAFSAQEGACRSTHLPPVVSHFPQTATSFSAARLSIYNSSKACWYLFSHSERRFEDLVHTAERLVEVLFWLWGRQVACSSLACLETGEEGGCHVHACCVRHCRINDCKVLKKRGTMVAGASCVYCGTVIKCTGCC